MSAIFEQVLWRLPNIELNGEPEHLISNFQNRPETSTSQMEQQMIVDYADIPYLRRGKKELLARVWNPPTKTVVRGVVLDVHGGAWCDHDRRAGSHYDAALAAAGFSVVAIDFRCGPEHQHPDASTDVSAAAHWARLRARNN